MQEIADGRRVKDPLKPHEAKDFYKNYFSGNQDEHLHPDESISQKGDDLQNTLYGKPPSQGGMSRASFANTEFVKNRNQAHDDARSFIRRNNARVVDNQDSDPAVLKANQGQGVRNGPATKPTNPLLQHIGEEVRNLKNEPIPTETGEATTNQANTQQKRNMPDKNPNRSFYREGIDGIVNDTKAKNPFIGTVAANAGKPVPNLDLSKTRAGAPNYSNRPSNLASNNQPSNMGRSNQGYNSQGQTQLTNNQNNPTYEDGVSQYDSQGNPYYDSQGQSYRPSDQQYTAQGQYSQPSQQKPMQQQYNSGKPLPQNTGRQSQNPTYPESQYDEDYGTYGSQGLEEQKGQYPNNQRGPQNQTGRPGNQPQMTPTYEDEYTQYDSQGNPYYSANSQQNPNQSMPNNKNVPQQKQQNLPQTQKNAPPQKQNSQPQQVSDQTRDSQGLFDAPSYNDEEDDEEEELQGEINNKAPANKRK